MRLALISNRKGAAAVEFAIVAPLLFVILFGTIQYGFLVFTYNSMLDVARMSARTLALGSQNESDTAATARAALPNWVARSAWTINARDVATTGTTLVDATISVPTSSVALMPFLPMPATLSAKVTMRKES